MRKYCDNDKDPHRDVDQFTRFHPPPTNTKRCFCNAFCACLCMYVGVLISFWLFLFPISLFSAQPKDFFLDGLKKLEQRSHNCVEPGGICRVNTLFQSRNLLFSLLSQRLISPLLMCTSLAPERLSGFYSNSVFESLSVICRSLGTTNILAPKICAPLQGLQMQNCKFF
jgi:hypothetical protein